MPDDRDGSAPAVDRTPWTDRPRVDQAAVRRRRLDELLPELLREQGLDLWLTFTREGAVDPLLPVLGVDQIVARGVFLHGWLGERPRKIAIAASYDVDPIAASGLYDEVIGYRAEGVKPHLRSVFGTLAPEVVAVNTSRDLPIADGLTAGMRDYLDETLGLRTASFVSSDRLVVSLLGRKLPEEIAALETAAVGTQQILAEALTAARIEPGRTTEQELDEWMRRRASELGFGVAFGSVVVGPQRGHSSPTGRVIERGDLVRVDWGATWEGYCADIQRTAYVLREGESEAPAWVRRLWETTLAANRAAVGALRPGATGNDVDRAGREVVTAAGYPDYAHATGHAIGLRVHDVGPMLGPDWPERYGAPVFFPIERGQVFAVEPAVYPTPDELGYETSSALEENVVVEPDGPRILGTPQTELILI